MASVASYIDKNSFIHNLHPLTKMIAAFWFLLVSITLNKPIYLSIILALVFGCSYLANISQNILKSLKGITIFAFFIFIIQILFYKSGEVAFYLIPGKNYFPITFEGISFGIMIALRAMIVLLSFNIFLATTKTTDMMTTFVENLKIPYDYAFMFVTALKFIPTFLEEAAKIAEAQKARGHKLEGLSPFKKIKAYAPLAIPLVLISLKKGERLALAMETRAYGLKNKRTYYNKCVIRKVDIAIIVGMFFILIGIVLFK